MGSMSDCKKDSGWGSGILGLWIGLILGGILALNGISGKLDPQTVQDLRVLDSRGVHVTLDQQGRMWLWDNTHRVSYRVDALGLSKLANKKD